jgi:hypothetical protein
LETTQWLLSLLVAVGGTGLWFAARALGRIEQIERDLKAYRMQFSKTFTPMEDFAGEGYMGWPKFNHAMLSYMARLLEQIALAQGVHPEKIKELRDKIEG